MSIHLLKFLNKVLKYFLHTFFPEYCIDCGKILKPEQTAFCQDCYNSLSYVNYSEVCEFCFRKKSKNSKHNCTKNTYLDRNISVFPFSNALQKLIHQTKYFYRQKLLKEFLNNISWKGLYGELPEVIIPVPLHKNKLKLREFNQAEILAKWVSSKTGIPLNTTHLIRKKDTTPQARIEDENKRKDNVKNAFQVNSSEKYKTVILVDDVMTTGNTLSECARVLKESGAYRVISFTLIRA